ncbi:MAG: four helix bundle protein [Candidatus Omnitrophota bacterium]
MSMEAKTYRDLEIWKKSMDLAIAAYRLAHLLPPEEKYNLALQIKRTVVSIPSQIAKGWASAQRGEFLQRLSLAQGALAELETLLAIAGRLNFTERDEAVEIWDQTQEVNNLLSKFIRSLREKEKKTPS